MSYKKKAILGFSWTIFEGLFSQGTVFLVGIILARLLTPKDFGVVGIISAILMVANSVVEAGFGSALIRKKSVTHLDYNTVFFVNLTTALFLYLLLFLFASPISIFFESLILENLIKVSGLVLIINALALIQRTILTRLLNFKKLGIIAVLSSVISGIISIFLAYNDYGVWSLVALTLLRSLFSLVFLWIKTNWIPQLIFSKNSFKELFGYGYKLLIGNLINTAYKNLYYFVIGKLFSPIALGYYTRADQFQTPVSNNIGSAIRRISFPILANFQNDRAQLKSKFVQFVRFSMFLNFSIMSLLAGMSKSIIFILIGEKWETSIYYLQLLCIPGILYPLQILHLNLLLVKGYSNLNLRLEIIKKIILLPIILITANYSIEIMLYGLIIFSLIEYFINSFYTSKMTGYTFKEQLLDFIPFLLIGISIFSSVYFLTFLKIKLIYIALLQLSTSIFVFILVNEIIKPTEYQTIRVKFISVVKKINIGK